MKKEDKVAKERYLKKLELIRKNGNINLNETPEQKHDAISRAKRLDWAFIVQRYFPHYATAETADFQIEFADDVAQDPTYTGFAIWGRGLAKSVWCNVIIPFGIWIAEGDNYHVQIAVNADRAAQLLEDLRAEFEANPQIIADFGEQHNPGHWDEKLWVTKGGYIGQALGFGQSCRGLRVGAKRPKYYSCDDLETRQTIKNEKRQDEMVEWVESELLPSMDGQYERLVFPNNWFAEVMFLKKLAALHPDWKKHVVKAYDPVTYAPRWASKYHPDYYRKKEKKMGVLAANAEYNHDAKPKGKIFKPEHIQWGKMPPLSRMKIIVGHWDVAYAGSETSDFNAVRIWALDKHNRFWFVTGFVKRTIMAPAIEYMCDTQRTLPPGVKIHWQFESQFWNGEVGRTLKRVQKQKKVKLNITKIPTPKAKKYDRILEQLPYYQNGRLYYNELMVSNKDSQEGLKQLYGIEPNYTGKDDSPDADSQCIEFLERHCPLSDEPETASTNTNYLTGKFELNNEAI